MRRRWVLAGSLALGVAAIVGVVVATSDGSEGSTTPERTATTAKVVKGELSAMVSLDGTLTYRARSDGSPYAVINQAGGIYTALPDVGDGVVCGDVLYRVDDHPVLLLCGTIPAFRDLHSGDVGNDVRQLNQNLGIGPDDHFTAKTAKALQALQHDKGLEVTGALALDDAVFLPDSVRIAAVTGVIGGSAQPGAPVLSATSDTLEVQVHLDAAQQGAVQQGDRAQIALPGNQSAVGKVDRLGRVAQAPAGQGDNARQSNDPRDATIPAYVTLDDPTMARGLDHAPVQVEITTEGVADALSVPVTAIVGRSGGGFALEVVRAGNRHELVTVKLGLFDTTAGRVQVEGDLREGDDVVVPSS